MNWEALGSIAELISGIAVLITLIYLAIQIRQNTATAREAILRSQTDRNMDNSKFMAGTPGMMDIFIRAMDDPGLMFSPPVSKQTPFPTNVSCGPASPQRMSSNRGARVDARPTVWISGKFAGIRSSPVITRSASLPGSIDPLTFSW